LVIFTARASQKPGESRLSLVQNNVLILKKILPELPRYCPEAVYLMVINPVNALTYAALKIETTVFTMCTLYSQGNIINTVYEQSQKV